MLVSSVRIPGFYRIVPLLMITALASVACSSTQVPESAAATPDPTLSPTPTVTARPVVIPTEASDLGPALPLSAETLDGRQFEIENYAGKPLVLFFWREHVSGVELELELLQELYETYSPVGVEFLTVTDREHGLGRKAQLILDSANATLPTVLLPDGELMRAYGLDLPPGVVLINEDQRVVWRWYGWPDRRQLTAEIANLAGIQPLPSRHSGTVLFPEQTRENFFSGNQLRDKDELVDALEPLVNQPVVVFVWASGITSEGQQRSLKAFVDLHEEFKQRSVGFIGLVAQSGGIVEQLRVDSNEFAFPVTIDEQSTLMTDTGIFSFPTTFYLDHRHDVAGVKSGALDFASARNLVEELLTERIQQGE